MRTAITIFLVVATVFAIATLCYVVVDVIMERMRKKNKEDKKEEKKGKKNLTIWTKFGTKSTYNR